MPGWLATTVAAGARARRHPVANHPGEARAAKGARAANDKPRSSQESRRYSEIDGVLVTRQGRSQDSMGNTGGFREMQNGTEEIRSPRYAGWTLREFTQNGDGSYAGSCPGGKESVMRAGVPVLYVDALADGRFRAAGTLPDQSTYEAEAADMLNLRRQVEMDMRLAGYEAWALVTAVITHPEDDSH